MYRNKYRRLSRLERMAQRLRNYLESEDGQDFLLSVAIGVALAYFVFFYVIRPLL